MISKTVCGSCGADNAPDGSRFCPNCGASLVAGGGSSNSETVPLAAATPINQSIPHVSATSVEETVSASTVTFDEPPRASSTTPDTAAAALEVHAAPVPQSAPTSSCGCASPRNSSSSFGKGGGIECANYFLNPTPEMLQRSRVDVMGGVLFIAMNCKQKGKFTVPQNVSVGRILGGVKLDLSLADFVHPTTIITVGAILGDLHVTVPRGVRVETQGLGILGSFRGLKGGQTVHAGEEAPLVIVRGLTILAGSKVQVNNDVPPLRIVAE